MRAAHAVSGRRRPRPASLRRQPGAALRPPAAEDGLACARAHTLAEPVRLLPLPRIRLVCPLHEASSSFVGRPVARRLVSPAPRSSSVPEGCARHAALGGGRGGTPKCGRPPREMLATLHVPQVWKLLWRTLFPCSSSFLKREPHPPHEVPRKFCRTHDTFLSTGLTGPYGRAGGVVRSPTSRPE